METISVIEAARLERDGGQRRLELARVALKDFFIEYPNGCMSSEWNHSGWRWSARWIPRTAVTWTAYQLREVEGR